MKSLFDELSGECSKLATKKYSTSFSLAIYSLGSELRSPVYSIYGFVRLADEIVDSFQNYNRKVLLEKFRVDTYTAITEKISLNPILNSFQQVVHQYQIRMEWIDAFMDSMAMDLYPVIYNEEKFNKYILGSAEAVGLMCLHAFTNGNIEQFEKLKPYAMKLGSAFQKVNFLRDLKADYEGLSRIYFPGIDMKNFTQRDKVKIEEKIENEFNDALKGIRMLPSNSRRGVYLAYYYYYVLFRKIKKVPSQRILNERIRIPGFQKIFLLFKSQLIHQLKLW